ncbi:unnamed protein product [Phytophthora fragariaefolia]|uniref:Unnamed protein product n=1 Tax=Phytophthora fragariaefolia TaxID=1490495 RepID=A0A9W6XH21_9STRA|nr:unnamed protein product [Phytophthora fragariaefolia]
MDRSLQSAAHPAADPPHLSMSAPGIRRDCSPDSPVSDRVWAQAIHAVVERRLSLRQAAQAFGLQQAALHRLVRQHSLQQAHHSVRPPPPARSLSCSSTSPTNSDNSRVTAPAASSGGGSVPFVLPRLNPLAFGLGSPTGGSNIPLPAVAPLAVMTPPPMCELTTELNDEIVAVLREQIMQLQQDYETSDGRYDRLEGYADADIADVVRTIVGHNGRRTLPPDFPNAAWLATFKRENDFVDVDGMVRARSRTSSGSSSLKSVLPLQQLQQERYNRNYEQEQQQYDLEQQRRGDQLRWGQNRSYRQPAAPPPRSPQQQSPVYRRGSYGWNDVEITYGGENLLPQQQQRLRYYQQSLRQPRDENKYRRSASAGSSNGQSDSNTSDRNYRQSNLVPAKVWERAMEDVAIRGMSLRNAAKAHGVHFAALHRRLKKRQQHKISAPSEPDYIPFEDEAGVVRVIHSRAEMGVLMTFTELVDLLKRTALKHRSELPEEILAKLVRRFQSRVEQSVRHLIIDWPAQVSNVLYRLRDTSSTGDDGKGSVATGMDNANTGKNSVPSIISGSGGEGGSLSSSGSSSSLSPRPQAGAHIPGLRAVGTVATEAWSKKANSGASIVGAGSNSSNSSNGNCIDNGGREANAATVSHSDENETILRL